MWISIPIRGLGVCVVGGGAWGLLVGAGCNDSRCLWVFSRCLSCSRLCLRFFMSTDSFIRRLHVHATRNPCAQWTGTTTTNMSATRLFIWEFLRNQQYMKHAHHFQNSAVTGSVHARLCLIDNSKWDSTTSVKGRRRGEGKMSRSI